MRSPDVIYYTFLTTIFKLNIKYPVIDLKHLRHHLLEIAEYT